MTAGSKPGWSAEARGFLVFVRILLIVIVAALVYGVAWLMWPPSAAPLPPGAAALSLSTEPTHIGARLVLGCPVALFPDVRVARDGDAMVFVATGGAGGAQLRIDYTGAVAMVWPPGWSARVVAGRAELVTPDGRVLAREGDLIAGLGGAGGGVCLTIGQLPVVRPAPESTSPP